MYHIKVWKTVGKFYFECEMLYSNVKLTYKEKCISPMIKCTEVCEPVYETYGHYRNRTYIIYTLFFWET